MKCNIYSLIHTFLPFIDYFHLYQSSNRFNDKVTTSKSIKYAKSSDILIFKAPFKIIQVSIGIDSVVFSTEASVEAAGSSTISAVLKEYHWYHRKLQQQRQ